MARAALLIGLVLVLMAPGSASAEPEVFVSDTRMDEANELLADETQYARALEIYRSVLSDDPDNVEARLWLARVLSWQGDHVDAITQYDRLLAMDPPSSEAEIERAEVLSWAGRYDEALDSFDAILARDPESGRAVLGKARIYAWSDRKSQAVKAYAQAVELSDDAEAEHELAELRAGLTVGGDASAGYTSDSDGYRASTFGSTGSFDIDFQTRAIASLDFARVGTNRGPLAATPGIPTDNSGLVGYAGLERDLPHDIEVSAEIGYRWWDRAPGHLLARGSIETYLASDTALGLSVAYGDFLPFSDSYAVVLSGIDSTNLRAHVWQGLPLRHSLFAYVDTAFVSDDNRRIGAGGSYEYQPLASVDLAIGISLEFLTCTERSLLYYDPELDLGGEAFLRLTQPVLSWLGLRLETAVGAGYAREVGLSGSGLTYLVSGGLDLRWRRLTLGLTASRHQSQRATTYTSQSFGASLNLEF